MSKFAAKFGKNAKDTGSPEVQIAHLTERISHLQSHFEKHKHDYCGKRGLMVIIGKRRSLLKYLQTTDDARYKKVIAALDIRK